MSLMVTIGRWYGFDFYRSRYQWSASIGWIVVRVTKGDFERALEAHDKQCPLNAEWTKL